MIANPILLLAGTPEMLESHISIHSYYDFHEENLIKFKINTAIELIFKTTSIKDRIYIIESLEEQPYIHLTAENLRELVYNIHIPHLYNSKYIFMESVIDRLKWYFKQFTYLDFHKTTLIERIETTNETYNNEDYVITTKSAQILNFAAYHISDTVLHRYVNPNYKSKHNGLLLIHKDVIEMFINNFNKFV